MEKVETIQLKQLRNSEYFELTTDLKMMLPGVLPSTPVINKILDKFDIIFLKMDEAMRLGRGSALTAILKEEDKVRGGLWKGMDLIIDAYLRSTSEEEVASATRLRRLFDVYGDFRYRSYNAESNDGRNLVQDLEKPKNAADCTLIRIDTWVPKYKMQLEHFKALQNDRNHEEAYKASGDVRVLREEMDPVYREIINKVNAYVELGMASPEIENFVRLFNNKIKNYKDTVAIRDGRKNSETDSNISDGVDS